MERNLNPTEISPVDVLLYVLGRVTDPERRAVIESTRATQAELWECLTIEPPEETTTAEHLEPDATEESIPDVVDDYFAQRAETRRAIEEIGEQLRASPDGRKLTTPKPLLRHWKAEHFGGNTGRAERVLEGACGSGSGPQYPELPEPPYVVVFQHRVYIAQPEPSVPYGVVRVLASVQGVPLASVVRVLEYDEDAAVWKLVVAATELFGQEVPSDDVDFHVQPARRELFEWFSRAEIETLAKRLPVGRVKERQGVEALLRDLQEGNHAV